MTSRPMIVSAMPDQLKSHQASTMTRSPKMAVQKQGENFFSSMQQSFHKNIQHTF